MICLAGIYLRYFDPINSSFPNVDLLGLPVWKFAALVEAWAWEHFDEKHHAELSMELRREVDWKWVNVGRSVASTRTNPLRWQENKAGESLLSVHRKD